MPDYDCEPDPPNTGDEREDCVARVNQFRQCVCLPPLQRWTEGESCADQQAEYDYQQGVAHAGFNDRICSPGGNAQNECRGWNSASQVIDGCLQGMFDEGPGPEGCASDPTCYMEHGHFINMTSDFSQVACGFYTAPGGEVWAVQNFQ